MLGCLMAMSSKEVMQQLEMGSINLVPWEWERAREWPGGNGRNDNARYSILNPKQANKPAYYYLYYCKKDQNWRKVTEF